MTTVRAQQKKQTLTDKIGTSTEDILARNIRIHELYKTSESIEVMDISCKHCGALKFKAEASGGLCCGPAKLFPRATKTFTWPMDTGHL